MDRISGLPDEILCHTLSFLSTKEAASTSLLSMRWRNLFTFTPNLRFVEEDEDLFNGNTGLDVFRSFCDFVDRVLAVSGNSPVKEFTLNYHHDVESAHINLWISNVLSRGVLDHLYLHVLARGRTPLPLAVFTCKTLVKLKLGRGFVIPMVPESASLPALKSLFLDCIRFDNHGYAFEALLSACRVLEQLLIRGMDFEDWEWCRTVSSATLKRLTISCLGFRGFCDADFKSTTFDTPSLTYLDYASFLPDEYPIVNLDSLVEAKLNLMGMRIVTNIRNPTNLIKGLRNVEILDLSTLKTCEVSVLCSFLFFCSILLQLEKIK
ncbi:F-box domain [Arabidopsis thaliana x Arabidopsis arenosa]|uniref:F-box domain n=1 Tax=Arabidopsis thaliana x Arabidopsis arenosa TaxID=1240361 RepID=A0A8T1ZRW3_9BRAS|nr:F-box domain [Arabidopsis thaliana x Arabidopsis arenosa]